MSQSLNDAPPETPVPVGLLPVMRQPDEGEANAAFGFPKRFVVLPEETGGAFAAWDDTIPEGEGPPLHIHHREHEFFFVTAGAVRFVAAGIETLAGPGASVSIPPGTPHTFRGFGPGVSRAVVTMTPGDGIGFFREVEQAGLVPPHDMPAIVEIGLRYGLEFVGPPLG